MTYHFPVISTINDVLPHIEDRPEIIVVEKDGYSVINYVISTPELWAFPVSTLKGQIIRECRGLIFDDEGYLMSRPFHKFFNVGEKEETLPNNLDFSWNRVYEKLDGSMIRPIVVNNTIRLATKMGITDTSIQCENWLQADAQRAENYYTYIRWCLSRGRTPIFEWVSRDNRIVVNYDESNLILTAVRDILTGVYQYYFEMVEFSNLVPIVRRYDSLENISDFLAMAKAETGNEGYVIEFEDGHRVKVKTDEYSRLHKLKEHVQQPRHVVALILDEKIDDIKAGLDAVDLKKVEDLETDFWNSFQRRVDEIDAAWEKTQKQYSDKKDFAINTDMEVSMRKFMFAKFSGKSTRDILTDLVLANIGGEKKYQEFWDGYLSK